MWEQAHAPSCDGKGRGGEGAIMSPMWAIRLSVIPATFELNAFTLYPLLYDTCRGSPLNNKSPDVIFLTWHTHHVHVCMDIV